MQTAYILRNFSRNRRRTAVAVVIIGFAVVALVLAEGFVSWIFWAMREAAIHSQSGHIQVVREGYITSGVADPTAYLLPEGAAARTRIAQSQGVRLVAPRLAFSGLISHGETTVSFVGEGVDPAKEATLSRAVKITQGNDLETVHEGKGDAAVILGRGLAENLGVVPGEQVVLLVNPSGGGINALELRVAGTFATASKDYDDTALRLPIGDARQLLRVSGSHAWLVLLENTEDTDRMLQQLRSRVAMDEYSLQFVPWYAQADFYNKTVTLLTRQMGALKVVIAVIVVLSIANILMMNVLERTGEIGTLMALGRRRGDIIRLFAGESIMLGLIGAALGLAVGSALAVVISAIGIPMPPPPGMDKGYTGEIMLTAEIATGAFLIAWLTTVVAGIYPAWRASRLQIVDALRQRV